MQQRCAVWRKAGENRTPKKFEIKTASDHQVKVMVDFDLNDVNSKYFTNYTILGSGDVIIENQFTPGKGKLPELPRFGMKMRIPDEFEQIQYYGRGPHENYCDRKTGSLVGIYKSTVKEQYVPYISPQENGNKTDVRWIALINNNGTGLLAIGMPLLSISALHYTIEDLTQKSRGTKHTIDLKERDFVALNLDDKQMGVGGDNSWGARTHPQYTLPVKEYAYKFRLRPFSKEDDILKLSKMRFDLK